MISEKTNNNDTVISVTCIDIIYFDTEKLQKNDICHTLNSKAKGPTSYLVAIVDR